MPILVMGQSSNISTFFTSNFKKAETLYNQLAYRNALQLYLHVAEKDPSNDVAKQRVADCYFRLGNILEAEKWYALLANSPTLDPKYKYQYAQILSIEAKYAESRTWYLEYLSVVKDDPRANAKLDFIDHLDYYLRDSLLYEISNEPYNSDQSDFAPQFYKNGIVFSSARNSEIFVKHQSFSALSDQEAMLNIFFASPDAEIEKDPLLFYQHELNSPYHDGPLCFYDGGTRVAFSRSNLKAGKPVAASGRVNLELYFAETKEKKKIGRLEPFPFNNDGYSIAHPWISEDGTILYFSSDMPGGQGGADLYKAEIKDGKWDAPENLGSSINTMGDEFYPFIANDTTLYFSSNGHGGLGGLDIYVSYSETSGYSLPKNLGFPLNTSSDDFSFIVDRSGRNGLFSSNRSGGAGYDDIYRFRVKSYFLDGRVVERSDTSASISSALIYLKNDGGIVIDSTISDTNGHFNFDLAFDRDYSLSVLKQDYSWIDEMKFSTHSRAMGHSTVILPLWKHGLFAKGIVYSNESQKPLPNALVTLHNTTDLTVDSLRTDQSGTYSFLVKPNKKYQILASKDVFLPEEVDLNTKGIFHGNLLNDMVLEEKFLDKVVIQFDFDMADIKDSEIQRLETLRKDLGKRKLSRLHISAFADSHGTHEYNQDLSDRRAKSVLTYFTSVGVDAKRIVAMGFGETLLLNRCSDGVECNEEEHSLNRRAELKVQMEK